MLNPKKVVQTFFYCSPFFHKKTVFVTKNVLFLVENCTLAKNESQSGISNKKHFLSQQRVFFLKKATIKKCLDHFFAFGQTVKLSPKA
jgi:hypothetical protein